MNSDSILPPEESPEDYVLTMVHNAIYQNIIHTEGEYDNEGIYKTLLMVAVEDKNIKAIHMILSQKIDKEYVNHVNDVGETALSYSLMPHNYDINIVKCLLEHGADPNINPKNEMNVLRAFDNDESLDALWLLIMYGANINIPYKPNILGISIMEGSLTIAFNLLNNNANPNIPNQYGINPLGNAACSKYTELIYDLIIHGADPTQIQGENENIIILASQCGSYNVLKTILKIIKYDYEEHIHDMLHHIDNNKRTPLIHAIENDSYKKVNLLIQYGANVNQCCPKGHIPLYYAIANGNIKIIKSILHAKPKITKEQIIIIQNYYIQDHLKPIIAECIKYFRKSNISYTLQQFESIRNALLDSHLPYDIIIDISHKTIETIYISDCIREIDIKRSISIRKNHIQ